MYGLKYLISRSIWVLSGAAFILIASGAGLFVYSNLHYLKNIDPLQKHLAYLSTIENIDYEMRKELMNMHRPGYKMPGPEVMKNLGKQLSELYDSESNLEQDTPELINEARQIVVGFDNSSQFPIELASIALRDALSQELVAHLVLVGSIHEKARQDSDMAIWIAVGLLLISATLWVMIRQRILLPLNKLASQMTLLASRHDYSELPLTSADPMLHPMIEKYNRMAVRLMSLEKLQQERHKTLTEEVRNSTAMLLQQQQSLAKAEKLGAVGEMAAGVAHELRNPLTSVLMALENLRRDTQDPEKIERIDLIASEVRRMTQQLNQLLDEARQKPEPEVVVYLHDEMNKIISLAAYQLHENVAIHLEVDPQLACLLPLARLHQVMLNLLLNAGQMLGDSGEIIIQAEYQNDMLRIDVRDTGPGFSAEMLETEVQPFRTLRVGGTGLGLVVIRRFISDLGGKMELSNPEGGGAQITLLIPCKQKIYG